MNLFIVRTSTKIEYIEILTSQFGMKCVNFKSQWEFDGKALGNRWLMMSMMMWDFFSFASLMAFVGVTTDSDEQKATSHFQLLNSSLKGSYTIIVHWIFVRIIVMLKPISQSIRTMIFAPLYLIERIEWIFLTHNRAYPLIY